VQHAAADDEVEAVERTQPERSDQHVGASIVQDAYGVLERGDGNYSMARGQQSVADNGCGL
jgi:hypothetical protein